ncbi:MAG TPA: hypothetical protein VGD40_07615 [Chryseosolibacter sp.]
MKNHAFVFTVFFIASALLPLPDASLEQQQEDKPKPRHLEEVAYNESEEALYLFGGVELIDKKWQAAHGLYTFKNRWYLMEETGPVSRRGSTMVYNSKEMSMIVIGGVDGDSVLQDVWQCANKEWKFIDANCPLKEARAVYDVSKDRILVYGDAHNISSEWYGGDPRKFELWEFKANTWRKLSDRGPEGPFPLTYDTRQESLSFLQWNESNQLALWQWKSDRWSMQTFDGNIPPPRNKYAFTYSKSQHALFLFGGIDSEKNLLADFWKYDGKQWIKLSIANAPSARASLKLVDAGERIFLYGGVTKEGITNELWEFSNNQWKKK